MLTEGMFDDARGMAEMLAANELRHLPGKWAIEDLVGLVDGYLDRALLPSPYAHPKYLAARSGFTPILDRLLAVEAVLAGSLILYRPTSDARHLGFVLRHEFAEGILAKERWPSNHTDVQIAAVLTLCHSRDMRRLGAGLERTHRYAPRWMSRVRVAVHESVVARIRWAESA